MPDLPQDPQTDEPTIPVPIEFWNSLKNYLLLFAIEAQNTQE